MIFGNLNNVVYKIKTLALHPVNKQTNKKPTSK